jgi:hypothetical protein
VHSACRLCGTGGVFIWPEENIGAGTSYDAVGLAMGGCIIAVGTAYGPTCVGPGGCIGIGAENAYGATDARPGGCIGAGNAYVVTVTNTGPEGCIGGENAYGATNAGLGSNEVGAEAAASVSSTRSSTHSSHLVLLYDWSEDPVLSACRFRGMEDGTSYDIVGLEGYIVVGTAYGATFAGPGGHIGAENAYCLTYAGLGRSGGLAGC